MIIELRDPLAGAAPEWILLELQGKLHAVGGADGSFDGRLIGAVRAASDGRLLLHVGTHVVEGKLATLDRALHVLRRQPAADEADAPAFVVACIVRRKLVFTDRPEQLISAASAALSGGPGRP